MSVRCGLLFGSAVVLCARLAAAEQVVKTIPVGSAPAFSTTNPDGSRVYVGNVLSADISVIDTRTDDVIATIPLQHNDGTLDSIHLAMAPDGATLYAVDENVTSTGTVNVISTATNVVVATVAAGARPSHIAIRPDGAEAYVVNHYGFSVSVITTATREVTDVPLEGYYPHHVAFSPDSRRAYVTRYGSGYPGGVTILDTMSRTVVGAIDDSGGDTLPFVSTDGAKLYVSCYNPSADGQVVLRIISTDTANDIYQEMTDLTGPAASAWLAVSADANKGYLFSSVGSTGQVLDTVNDRLTATVTLPGPAAYPTWDATTGRVFVPHFQGNSVSAIDVASDAVVATYQTGNEPWSLTIAAGKKYVTNRADGTVSVIGEPPAPAVTSTSLTSSLNPSTYGQAITLKATVTRAGGTPMGGVEFFDGDTSLGIASLDGGTASLTTTAIGAGTRSIAAVYAGATDTCAGSTSPALTQTVNKATGTTSLTVSVLTPQYSDLDTFRASFTPSTPGGAAPAKASFKVGTQLIGEATPTLVSGVYQYTWTGQLLDPPGTTTRQMKPDFRAITATFIDPNFAVTNPAPKAITIQKEDARVAYKGPTSVFFGGTGAGIVPLRVLVTELTDGYPGDIRNAQVSFVDRSTNTIIATVGVGADGVASYNWSVNLGTAKSKSYTLGFIVGYYYNRNSTGDNALIVVSK